MLSVEQALEKILSHVSPMGPVEVDLPDALGLTLAEEVTSPLDLPPMDNSAMDGFAVRHVDVAGAGQHTPRELPVIGYVQAGALPDRALQPGAAIRIMTGAPIPPGADAVVPFEDTDEVQRKAAGHALDRIRVLQEAPPGANVRPAGEDLRAGERLMGHGDVLRPGEIGVLASVGRQRVTALRRPIIAILSTGDELLAPGEAPGGSKGDYDFIKDVLTANGEIAFWSVRMRPARPLAFGVLHAPNGRRVPHIGLPGNPVSALVAFEQFCRPAILKMLGRSNFAKPRVRATLRDPIINTDGRRVYARAIVTWEDGRWWASLTGPQGSNLLTSMARANGLAICPEDLDEMPAGAEAEVQMLDWPEEAAV